MITFDKHADFIRSDSYGSELYADEICPKFGMEIPPNVWHTVLAKQENSILLEVKEGPFVSDKAKEIVLWAPRDGSAEVVGFLAKCLTFSDTYVCFF